jgi:hypothetical protein
VIEPVLYFVFASAVSALCLFINLYPVEWQYSKFPFLEIAILPIPLLAAAIAEKKLSNLLALEHWAFPLMQGKQAAISQKLAMTVSLRN